LCRNQRYLLKESVRSSRSLMNRLIWLISMAANPSTLLSCFKLLAIQLYSFNAAVFIDLEAIG
jgi:hypothetical protein